MEVMVTYKGHKIYLINVIVQMGSLAPFPVGTVDSFEVEKIYINAEEKEINTTVYKGEFKRITYQLKEDLDFYAEIAKELKRQGKI